VGIDVLDAAHVDRALLADRRQCLTQMRKCFTALLNMLPASIKEGRLTETRLQAGGGGARTRKGRPKHFVVCIPPRTCRNARAEAQGDRYPSECQRNCSIAALAVGDVRFVECRRKAPGVKGCRTPARAHRNASVRTDQRAGVGQALTKTVSSSPALTDSNRCTADLDGAQSAAAFAVLADIGLPDFGIPSWPIADNDHTVFGAVASHVAVLRPSRASGSRAGRLPSRCSRAPRARRATHACALDR
jgi:hypothetical protein